MGHFSGWARYLIFALRASYIIHQSTSYSSCHRTRSHFSEEPSLLDHPTIKYCSSPLKLSTNRLSFRNTFCVYWGPRGGTSYIYILEMWVQYVEFVHKKRLKWTKSWTTFVHIWKLLSCEAPLWTKKKKGVKYLSIYIKESTWSEGLRPSRAPYLYLALHDRAHRLTIGILVY